ncbi:hypothetical protein PGT21_020821 [Puccinia graminis f. sp. tritici]|uniref:Uncharacterized protein n=1 Tax=Puccinia graminis f. sp. tritici TaxID=56615 RepID=A0A5B0NGU0_PUCGR|nr:hypothetical protein PGT21_020821 [Puccinia graminis f. sp. tritici]
MVKELDRLGSVPVSRSESRYQRERPVPVQLLQQTSILVIDNCRTGAALLVVQS